MRRAWTLGMILAGFGIVGVIYGCIWYAIPGRPVAKNWPLYGPLLLGPYTFCAMGCWLSADRFVRALALLVCFAGCLMVSVAILDAWPAFRGGPPSHMMLSTLAGVFFLGVQYTAAVFGAVLGVVTRRPRRV